MFIGHFAPALAAAAISPRAPKLATLFVAAQLVDWAFFTFAFFGIERMRVDPDATVMVPLDLYHMPYTHSLLGTAIWAIVFTGLVLLARKDALAALLGGFVVLSHWILDWLTHRPDLSLAGGEEKHGLGLWNEPMLAIPLELGITVGAFYWYMKSTRGPVGPPAILLFVLLAFQAINWFGPPPQVAGPFLYAQALLAFLLATLFAAWVGTTRKHKRAVLFLSGPRR
ncbi:metal-dependent hydrolase [Altererythrobacter lutimaris]|uniref:Metal-dependent hydrolase n=1 Tax=Altererythrobacter lutimaris TaxID=2743979 RepID=A0A850H8Z7_9SPHN|nr:hypothetical protein [Altererythrobacter lutimaris]NVE93705.1 hypothetical protein [Altererythrobacter lutimaris]